MPSLIHGIHEDPVELVPSASSAPKGAMVKTATSLRFYYVFDMVSTIDISKPLCTSSESLGYIQPTIPGSGKIDHADITVRYGSSLEEDVDHLDAQECFLRTRDLLGLKWWVSYDEKKSNMKILVRSGVDCRAPIIVSQP